MFLYDDKLVLTFNFKDGTRTMTMDDLDAVNRNGKKDADGSDMDEVTPLHNRQSGYLHPNSDWRKKRRLRKASSTQPALSYVLMNSFSPYSSSPSSTNPKDFQKRMESSLQLLS